MCLQRDRSCTNMRQTKAGRGPKSWRPSMDDLLEVQRLTVSYRTADGMEFPVISEVNFKIARGEVLGLLGESGSGKSTTALAIAHLLPPNARVVRGSVKFLGRELLSLDERALEKIRGAQISWIFQEPGMALNPVIRVGDQIADVIRVHRGGSPARWRQEAETALRLARLPDLERIYSAYPHQLSRGQQQRVLIALALACQPALIIADEPTAALDTAIQAEILALLKELKARLELALLFISHSPAVLSQLADRILVMYAGRIVEDATLSEMYENALHPYTLGLLRSIPSQALPTKEDHRSPLLTISGSPPDFAHLPDGCPFEPRCPDRMEVCRNREPEEVRPTRSRRVRCFKYGG
jgi:oligopeptide/dipeptide ABC transporter ATP-binding protein